MAAAAAHAVAAELVVSLSPKHLPIREPLFGTCAELFTCLGPAASPPCDALLGAMATLYADVKLGTSRAPLNSALGHAAKAIGPERFVTLLPLKVWCHATCHVACDAACGAACCSTRPSYPPPLARPYRVRVCCRGVRANTLLLHPHYIEECLPCVPCVVAGRR
jgi:hypothetical protein